MASTSKYWIRLIEIRFLASIWQVSGKYLAKIGQVFGKYLASIWQEFNIYSKYLASIACIC